MSTVSVNAIVDASGGNTATINGIPLRQGVLDPQNLIINGAFDFWQRGTSFTTGVYGADRWFNGLSGGTVTQSRQAFTVGDTIGSTSPTYFLRQNVTGQTTSAQYAVTTQRIEGVRSYAGQTITVLGWAKRATGTGNMALEAEQSFGTGGSPSASVTSISPTTVTLTTSWAAFAVTMTIPSITGKTLGTNLNDYLAINFWASAGSTLDARSNSLGLQTIAVDLWGVHIKLGTQTTAAVDLYKRPEQGPELERCQRYYQKLYPLAVNPGNPSGMTGGIYDGGGFSNISLVRILQRMRTTPAYAIWDDAGNSGKYTLNGSTPNQTPVAFDNFSDSGFKLFTAAGRISFFWAADAEL